jgi:hypothetical protein
MAIHQGRSFSESLISGNVEIFPTHARADRTGETASEGSRADGVVAIAVLAFVVGLFAVFAVCGARNGPAPVGADAPLVTMYGP